MKTYERQIERINKDDQVEIAAQGIIVRGTVLTAQWYGERDGWYIEMDHANVPGGYSYWKQGYDGGRINKVNGLTVLADHTAKIKEALEKIRTNAEKLYDVDTWRNVDAIRTEVQVITDLLKL